MDGFVASLTLPFTAVRHSVKRPARPQKRLEFCHTLPGPPKGSAGLDRDRHRCGDRMKYTGLPCAVAIALAGCAEAPPPQAAAVVDTSKMPQAGIFTVKDVVVIEQGQNTLRLAAATTNKFTFADLSAVVWCRAREEAVARKYDGWYEDGIQQISNGPDETQSAIATARYFKGKPPEGKKDLKHEKSPCDEVPAAAKVKA